MRHVVHNKRTALKLLAAGAAALFHTAAADAHHSFALFDRSKLTSIVGTVREWKWANPHTWLVVAVRKSDGSTEEWALVGSSPNMMSRWGWNAADIKVGDELTIDVHRASDGQHVGELSAVFLPAGKVLLDPGGQPGEALAAGPTNLPTKPQGEPYK